MSPVTEPRIQRWKKPACAWRALGLALLLAASLPSQEARAQAAGDVQAALDRTDQILARADAVLLGGQNQLALDYLDQAKQFQARARSAFGAGLYADALRLTETSRRRAFAAIDLAQQAGSAGFLLFAVDRTDAFLERIAPFLRECPNEPATRLFTTALDLQARAKEALRLGRPRVALSLTTDARSRAARALRLAESACGESSERARRAVERTDQLLDDSAWLTDAGDKAAQAYDAARKEQHRARTVLDQGRYAPALDLTLRARDQLVRALNRSDRPLAREAVAEAVRRSQEQLDHARAAAGTDAARAAVERASERQRRAQDLLERGRLAASLAEVHAVRTILDRAGL